MDDRGSACIVLYCIVQYNTSECNTIVVVVVVNVQVQVLYGYFRWAAVEYHSVVFAPTVGRGGNVF